MNKLFKFNLLLLFIGSFTMISCEKDKGLPVDGDGNVYRTVTIGTQVWMSENLKTTKTSLGAQISLITDNTKWENSQVAAYCWYDNNEELKDTYGALYNYHAAKIGVLCPTGYHLPTYDDWMTLFDYVGGSDIAGIKLRETGTIHWAYYSPNTLGTNETGFIALPGGNRTWYGEFMNIYYTGSWWISDKRNISISWSHEHINIGAIGGQPGFSIRCIKDN